MSWERSLDTVTFVPHAMAGDIEYPAYVIAGGENADGPWRLEVEPSQSPDGSDGVDVMLVTRSGGSVIAQASTNDAPIQQAGADPTFGVVTKEASTVQLRPDDGSTSLPAFRSPLPPSLQTDLDVFFGANPGAVPVHAVALDADGDPIGTAVPAVAASLTPRGTYPVAPFDAFGTSWELSASRDGQCTYLFDVGLQRGSGGCTGAGYYGPLPSGAFVFGPLTRGVTADVVAQDGRTYPAIAVGSAPDGQSYFAVALEGRGPGTLRMLDAEGNVVFTTKVTWRDPGRAIGQG